MKRASKSRRRSERVIRSAAVQPDKTPLGSRPCDIGNIDWPIQMEVLGPYLFRQIRAALVSAMRCLKSEESEAIAASTPAWDSFATGMN